MIVLYIVISIVSGILFGALDGVINGNPLAARLYAAYKPIARTSINIPAGVAIDLLWGFAMAGLFLVLYPGLPGQVGVLKGLSFGLIAWFFRVLMQAASQWMTFVIPARSLLYTAAAGLAEMLILGLLYGLTLSPAR